MFEAKIISGCWQEGTIELRGMPESFMLSARKLMVLEISEYEQLKKENSQAVPVKDGG